VEGALTAQVSKSRKNFSAREGYIVITMDEVQKISHKIALENGISDDTLSGDISNIVYHIDVLECGDTSIIDRHIDIEYSFGEYYEVREDTLLFQFICNYVRFHCYRRK